VNADHDRDRALDQALKATLGRGADAPNTPACLDAETLAAWMDGGLDAPSVVMAEAHASHCARCQALIGTLARVTPAVTASGASPMRLWRWWLAPLAAGAAAVTLWMVVPTDRYSEPPAPVPPQTVPRSTAADGTSQLAREVAPAPPKELQKNAPSAGKAQPDPNKLADKPAERRDRTEPRALEEQGSAKAAAPAPMAPAAAAVIGQLRAQVALPDDVQITATASPSASITWFVGRAGVVLLTVDGKTVARLPFPETVDLTAITATDARTAIVTTADGRVFRTEDGGKTWRRP